MGNAFENYRIHKRILAEALVEKDYMEIHEAYKLKNDYIVYFGEQKYQLHKLEINVAKTKLKLEMMQVYKQFDIPMDIEHIDRALNKEFEKQLFMLKVMKRDIDFIHRLNEENQDNAIKLELKELYLEIAALVHPELIQKSDKKTNRLWKSVVKAFKNKDLIKLKKLKNKVSKEFSDTGELKALSDKNIISEIKNLRLKAINVNSEIEKLKGQFPFNEAKLLSDSYSIDKYKKSIELDIKIAKELLDSMEKKILEKLPAPSSYLN